MRTVVVSPTYNERENLEEFVARLRESASGAHLLVVDDNSPGGTGELADESSRRYPGEIAVLHRTRKEGLGRAYVAGFRHALAAPHDVVVQMDADLSHGPRYVPSMLERIERADLVLGSRYVRGIAVVHWDFKRLILSKMATRYVQLVTRMPFTDATGGFKCWRREALEAIDLDGLFSNGYLFQIETTYKAWRRGLRIVEVPIIFYERNLGRSKMDMRIILEAVWGVLRLRLRA